MPNSKRTRKYGLFVKNGKSWVRVLRGGMPLAQARTAWQGYLLTGSAHGHSMALRPVKDAMGLFIPPVTVAALDVVTSPRGWSSV